MATTQVHSKAQKVRKNRLEALGNDYIKEAEKIFSWILDLMDADTKANQYGDITIYFLKHDNEIVAVPIQDNKCFKPGDFFFFSHDKLTLFQHLKEIIEKEEGFKVSDFEPNTTYYDESAIKMTIEIEP